MKLIKGAISINTFADKKQRVCVIGAGNGGLATAADLTLRSHEVTLFELPEFEQNIKEVKQQGGIKLETLKTSGLKGGFAKLYKITTNISEALRDTEIVLIVTPAFAHKKIAQECAEFLTKDHTVVLAPGNMGGSLEFYHTLIDNKGDKDIIVSELECMMYACRKKDHNTVYIRGYKKNLGFSTFPSVFLNDEFEKIQKIYPDMIKRKNIIETGMSNINPILHVPILLSNLSLIDKKQNILMYHEALTSSIGNIAKSLDRDRCSLNQTNKAINLEPMKLIYKNWYAHQGSKGSSFVELVGQNPIYFESKLPQTLNHRYILEDIPYGLIPMASILEKFGAHNTNINSVINLACMILGVDLYKLEEARTLETLRIKEKSPEDIINYITDRS